MDVGGRDRGVPVYVHGGDAARARGEEKKPNVGLGPWRIGPLARFMWYGLLRGGFRTTPIREVRTVRDGETLDLPGSQQQLVDAVLDTGTPAVLTLLAGRPYALGRATTEAAGILEAFFAGEEGAPAIAGVLSGRVNPSGRLPVSIPSTPGAQPTTYLAAPLAQANDVSNVDPTAAFAFGHGLGYTTFDWESFECDDEVTTTDGATSVRLRVRNTGDRAGTEVVQLYLHDPVASVVRPVQRLIGFARVDLEAGAACDVWFTVPADLASFTSRSGERIVEPGDLVLSVGCSSGDLVHAHTVRLEGRVRVVDHTRRLHPLVDVEPVVE